ncbi:hypothetical protein LTR47_006784 [Exophiala xenobiotica]|nr:hypothetical protein LTR41_007631 [Exophiala xenobiotica]KAK5232255.1 hypothetical protein LTR47_006784 [Exophiala xenobiotica]KAK5244669.1 hypothetical protein LTS06_009803 [Exophiala xenobiotica]KAK5347301.1 hypothetical protein LTR61_008888 [Exophiala xenobiotica]KAK5363768.1 hypothetical protein LTR11_009196 [Exophiala xenobiotica]
MVIGMQISSADEILPATSQFAQRPAGHDEIRSHGRTTELAEHDGNRTQTTTLPHVQSLPSTAQHDYLNIPSRARAWHGLPLPSQSSHREGNGERSYGKSFSAPDPAREVSEHARPGLRQILRDYWSDLKGDSGAADQNLARTNSIGDTGIDIQALRRLQRHARISNLVGSSLSLSSPALGQGVSTAHSRSGSESGSETSTTRWKRHELGFDSGDVSRALYKLKDKIGHSRDTKEAKYVQNKGEVAVRRSVVLLLTYCFMLFGAPSHRIEDYVLNLFDALGLDGRVNYIVGCTEICFINAPHPSDPTTRYSYTTLVKAQGLDVGRLGLSFRLYKDIVHGDISLDEAETKLIELIDSPPFYKPWFLVPLYGVASALLSVWAFKGYWTDMSASFALGCIVGVLQIVVTSRNPLYTNVLEVTAAVITSFGARAFASIGGSDQKYFCFGAIAESSIATLLPGYIVLCGALELQSKSVTAGSTRLFYAVIYSLFLGYGINVGSQLWAVIYPSAPTSAICPRTVDVRWKIVLVPTYLVVQAMLIRSRPIQIPLQVLFGSAAYTVDYFVSRHATAQIADTASAFTLGVLGHLYSRSRHGFAFASIIAGIMVLVPGGIAAQGGLISGITVPLFSNETVNAQQIYADNQYQSFSVGAQMIQVAVGLSVGLLISALAIYPLGRKNNALFSF